jgi:hypothetical protein
MRYAASPNALRRRTVLFQYGGPRLGERRSTGNVGRLAERGKEADDADWLGHHGDELHPALAGWALERVERKRAAQELGPRPIAAALALRSGVIVRLRRFFWLRRPRSDAHPRQRGRLADASPPAYLTVWKRGGGTLAASRHKSKCGSIT